MSQANNLVKHSTIYALGNISRQLVSFIMLPVYTRFLTPADYGVVGLLVFMVSLIELLFGGHMFHAVPKFYHDTDDEFKRNRVVSTALIITSIISTLAVIISITFGKQISTLLFGSTDHTLHVMLFSTLVLTHALESYALVYIRLLQRPWFFIFVTTGKLIVQLSMNIYFVVFLEWGAKGVAFSAMLSSLIFGSTMAAYTYRKAGFYYCKEIARKLFKFSWPLWIGGIAGLYIGSSNRYFLRIFGSLDEVGLFELAAKFGTVITILIWGPFSQYWQIERFKIFKEENAQDVYRAVFKNISTIIMVAALGISLFADPTIRIMADKSFHDAALAVPFLVYAAAFQCFIYFNNFSFLIKENTTWMSKNSYITAAIISIFYFILIPKFGFLGASASVFLAFLAQYIIVYTYAKKSYDMNLESSHIILAVLISTACIFIATYQRNDSIIIDILQRILLFSLGATLVAYQLIKVAYRKLCTKN